MSAICFTSDECSGSQKVIKWHLNGGEKSEKIYTGPKSSICCFLHYTGQWHDISYGVLISGLWKLVFWYVINMSCELKNH